MHGPILDGRVRTNVKSVADQVSVDNAKQSKWRCRSCDSNAIDQPDVVHCPLFKRWVARCDFDGKRRSRNG